MLDLIPSLMIITAVVFLGLIAYLNKVLYEPLLNFMDQRDASISHDLKVANELNSQSEELENRAEEILNKAKQEATKIRQEAISNAKAKAEEEIKAKEAELEKAYNDFLAELEEERKEVENTLKSQIPLIKESIKAKFAQI